MKLHISLLISLALPHALTAMDEGVFEEACKIIAEREKRTGRSRELTDHQQLYNAFQTKNLKEIEKFLDKTKDFNQPIILSTPDDPNGNILRNTTLLELAWQHSLPDVVSKLRGYGVSVETTDAEGNTPLAQALEFKISDLETLMYLTTENSINKKNNKGNTPLLVALSQNSALPSIIRFLLEQGANPTEQNDQGSSAIHFATRDTTSTILNAILERKKKEEVTELVNLPGISMATPLHVAIDCVLAKKEKATLSTINTLLANGADLAACNDAGNTPIHCAALDDPSGVLLEALLKYVKSEEERDKLVNLKNKKGATALHLAIEKCLDGEQDQMQNIAVLLHAGAFLGEENIEGVSPYNLVEAASGMPHAKKLLDFIQKCVDEEDTQEEKPKDENLWTKFTKFLAD